MSGTEADGNGNDLIQPYLDNSTFRFLGWRPVGASPVFQPNYTRDFHIKSDAEPHTAEWYDKKLLTKQARQLFDSAHFRARFDGLFVMDMIIDEDKLRKQSGGDESAAKQVIHRVASEVAMLIKTELKHPHYFHTHVQSRHPSNGILSWIITVLVLTSLFLSAPLIAFHLGTTRGLTLIICVIAWALALGVPFAAYMLKQLKHSSRYLSPDRMLQALPIEVLCTTSEELSGIPLNEPDWLATVHACEPAGAKHPRLALGQMRRGFIKNYESISELVASDKQSGRHRTARWQNLFWFTFLSSVAATGIAFILYVFDPAFPAFALVIAVMFLSLVIFSSAMMLVFFILNIDLPRVKLLRATHGFFAAADPFNDVVTAILHSASKDHSSQFRAKMNRGSLDENQKLTYKISGVLENGRNLASFAHIQNMIKVQIQGESQRLQIRQFWVAALGAGFGAIVAALAIVLQTPP